MQERSKVIGFILIMIAFILMIISTRNLKAQSIQQDSTYKRHYIGSSLYLSGNVIPNDPNSSEYVQLNFGYRITPKDVVSFEFRRSIYSWPLAIPFGLSFDTPCLNYPGHVHILPPTLGYQRFWLKGACTSV
jgi:hypothetical protein